MDGRLDERASANRDDLSVTYDNAVFLYCIAYIHMLLQYLYITEELFYVLQIYLKYFEV